MLKIINPATEEIIRELPEDNARTVAEKFAKAKTAQTLWAARPLTERTQIMKKFLDLVMAEKEKLARMLTSEMGKPVSQARGELSALSGRIGFFLENTASVIADETVFSDPAQKLEEKITHEPLGVIGNISAWNYPYFVGSNVFVPALLTGNAVLYKPSEFATLTGLEIERLIHEAGVPKDVFTTVIGSGSVGSVLLHQSLNGIFFTGSYKTGLKIAEAASRHLMRTQLELGGKDPVYICEDVDVNAVAEGTADGAFYNTGQSCCSVERIYVHAKIYDQFVDHFVKTVRGFVMGDPLNDKTYIGPLTRKPQMEILDAQIADATKKGAKLVCGGKRAKDVNGGKGYFYEPTVLVNVNHSMELMHEESFGPIIGIQKVEGDAEALGLMNDTKYGLTAGIYTKDAARAKAVMSKLNSGSAYWNCCDRVSPRLPWSGRGHSGVGSTLSKFGILAFVQPKGWHLRQ